MYTKNYYKMCAVLQSTNALTTLAISNVFPNNPIIANSGENLGNVTAAQINVNNKYANTIIENATTISTQSGRGNVGYFLTFGSGENEETIDDYKLTNLITSLSLIGGSVNWNDTNIAIITTTIQATENIIIKEVGLNIREINNVNGEILLNRVVLDEPIELSAGDIYGINFYIK